MGDFFGGGPDTSGLEAENKRLEEERKRQSEEEQQRRIQALRRRRRRGGLGGAPSLMDVQGNDQLG